MTTTAAKAPARWFALVRNLFAGLVFLVVVVFLLLWLAGSFRAKVPAHAAGPVHEPLGDRTLVAARYVEVPRSESAVGTISAVQQTTIAPEVLGKVIEVNAIAGQRVTAGDVLVRLDDIDLNARVKQAESSLAAAEAVRDQARVDHERIRDLYARQAASLTEFQRAENDLRAAEARVSEAEQVLVGAQKNLSYATIRAPFDAVIIDKRVDVGDTVSPGQTLLTLYDPTRMQLVAAVRESLIDRVHTGDLLEVQIDALNRTCHGEVTEIVPESDVASRTFLVKVSGPCPPDIHTGMFGRMRIPLGSEKWLVIPRTAIQRVGQLDMVHVADETGQHVVRRLVTVGRTLGDDVEVLSGLRADERIAVPADAAAGDRS